MCCVVFFFFVVFFQAEDGIRDLVRSRGLGDVYKRQFPLYLALFYPVTTVLVLFIAARSMALAVRGRSTWKGRTMVRARIRWW